jgi:hypothetical protein
MRAVEAAVHDGASSCSSASRTAACLRRRSTTRFERKVDA